MDRDANRAAIRAQIRPMPKEAHYPTSWSKPLTFAEIRDTLTPSINRLMRYYRFVEDDIPDMMAHGFMRLWEDLSREPDLLTSLDQGGAIKRVLYRCNSPHYKKFYRRQMYLDDLATQSGDPDEFIIDGLDHSHLAGHAPYAEQVDTRIDIEQVMHHMAKKYEHSQPHLMALYYITTQVTLEDAAALAGRSGTKTAWWLTSIVKPMREELRELLDMTHPSPQTWQDKLRDGDRQPLQSLVAQYAAAGNTRMTATLTALAEARSTKSLMEELDLPKSHVHYLRRTAQQELNKVYQVRVA